MFEVFRNDPADVKELVNQIYQLGVESNLDVFDVRMQSKRVLRGQLRLLPVLEISTGVTEDLRNLMHMVPLIFKDTRWCGLGIGRFQLSIATLLILLGGEVRLGLEDTAYFRKGELAKSNAQLVQPFKLISSGDSHFESFPSHATPRGTPTIVGNDVVVNRRVTLHGCNIHDRVLVGMGAIILDGAEVEEDSTIGAGSLLSDSFEIT